MHRGMPTFGWSYPIQYLQVPEEERAERCSLGSDDCVIDEELFFVRGCIEIPVEDCDEPFAWGAWVSLSRDNFHIFIEHFGRDRRSHLEPMFGWLCSRIVAYPDTLNLKTRLHLRDDGIRPYIELEPTDHPLAVEQRSGISQARVAEIYALMTHLGEGTAQQGDEPNVE